MNYTINIEKLYKLFKIVLGDLEVKPYIHFVKEKNIIGFSQKDGNVFFYFNKDKNKLFINSMLFDYVKNYIPIDSELFVKFCKKFIMEHLNINDDKIILYSLF